MPAVSVKVLCPSCERLAPPARFRVDAGALRLTCSRCGAELTVDLAPAESEEAPRTSSPSGLSAVPAPKASVPGPRGSLALASSAEASNVVALRTAPDLAVERAAAAAAGDPFTAPQGHCPKCIAPRGADEQACSACGLTFALATGASFEPPDWLRTRWREVLMAWGSDVAHDRLRTEAVARDSLVELGRLYRIRLADLPDDPWGKRAREEILRQASVPFAFTQAPASTTSPTAKLVMAGVALLALAAALALMLRALVANLS